MFHKATLRLTGWYLLILMTISLIFSLAIYSLETQELNTRLEQLQHRIERARGLPGDDIRPVPDPRYDQWRDEQSERASTSLLISLAEINMFILVAGGVGSYFLARRTLAPIEAAHEAQARFVSDASHELRTPLTVLKAENELALRSHNSSQAELRSVLSSNLEEIDKLIAMVHMLLALSKSEQGLLEVKPINLQEIIEDVIRRQNGRASRVEVKSASTVSRIQANPESIEELLSILLDNALKYSPDDSKVRVQLTGQGNKVSLAITNSGKGISPEDLPYIFDRFYRADPARSAQSQPGYGLGLALAKQIVIHAKGELLATSGLGADTTFTVLLPLASKQSPSKAKSK